MKKLIFATTLLALFACKKEENKESSGPITKGITNVKTMNNLSNSMEDINKNIVALKKMTPLTNDEMKSVLPETLSGMKRTEVTVGGNAMLQVASAEAVYTNDNIKSVRVNVMDGAGETGSGMIAMLMMAFSANMERTTETGFEKITDVNGTKMSVKEQKNGDRTDSKIQFIVKDRYLISLDGDGFSYEELAKTLNEINLSGLK